ncbi:MAG: hypothetical protein NC124_13890 [Clostridium sp.]|nr:hypothetical protein [Clostridium sp.]
MKDEIKRVCGNLVIKIGEQAVGKCIIPGMFDPEIPQKLRLEMEKDTGMASTYQNQ